MKSTDNNNIICCNHTTTILYFIILTYRRGVRGGAVGWGTALQAEGRGFNSRWCHCNFSSCSMALTEMSIWNISWRVKAPGA